MDAATHSQIVHPTRWMMAGHRMPTVLPTRWRWTHIEEEQSRKRGEIRQPKQDACAVYFPEHGSWYRVAITAHYAGLPDYRMMWWAYELQCTPAYVNGDPDTEAWGPVEEHGFECMSMPASHSHDPYAVQWMESINSAMVYVDQGREFKLEEFE
tara:strand:- start:57 stop:518 length:462 start_codon:yes stop_codon:yes gene_type:complete